MACEDDIFSSIKALRSEKASGYLEAYEDIIHEKDSCGNVFPLTVIQSFLHHRNEEIRLEVLSLIVDSKKSTSGFVAQELELIMIFLARNLGEKIEFIPLIKKAFKRIKESLAVFRRNVAQLQKIKSQESKVEGNIDVYKQVEEEYTILAEQSIKDIENYRKFSIDVRLKCLLGITPGATHIRKRNCLRILQLQQEFLSNEFVDFTWNEEQGDKLFQCLLLDTYETNKEIAFQIVSNIDPLTFKLDDRVRVNEILNVALKLGDGMRPIDSITASYMLKVLLLSPIIKDILQTWISIDQVDDPAILLINMVLKRLQASAKLANENIIAAAAKHSLYGYVFCIYSLLTSCDVRKFNASSHNLQLQSIKNILDKIITVCLSLNIAVSVVVNNSSPEGHFPMDLDSENLTICDEDQEVVTPQMVLLCSWRTVKEVSLLFGYLTTKFSIEGEDSVGRSGLLSRDQILQIGEHLVTMLCETKHRGAFEQTYVGFEQLCGRLWRLKQKSLNELPKIWLQQLLLAITGLSRGNVKLCATRRSAGVPFMVQALVASEPAVKSKSDSAIFHSVMKVLLGLTQVDKESELLSKATALMTNYFPIDDGSEVNLNDFDGPTLTEVKTHALNILRALFKHAQLGELARNYAADGFIAAIKSYDEKTWAERNAATLLYSALITRIFGVQRSKDYVNLSVHNRMTGRMFFEKYPSLLNFMLRELKSFVDETDSPIRPSVQSILLLLSRLYVNVHSDVDDTWKTDEFVTLVSACAKSRIYTTRELAARAVVPLLTEKTVAVFINGLFQKINEQALSQKHFRWNLMHGYILQLLEIAKSGLLTSKLDQVHLVQFIDTLRWIWSTVDATPCFPLIAVYVDLLDVFLKLFEAEHEGFLYEIYCDVLNELIDYVLRFQLSDQRPGKDIFELSAVNLIIDWGLLTLNFAESTNEIFLRVWKTILKNSKDHVRDLAWKNVFKTASIMADSNVGRRLINSAIDFLILQLMSREIANPESYDVFCDALYDLVIGKHEQVSHQINVFEKYDVNSLWSTISLNFKGNRVTASSFKLIQCISQPNSPIQRFVESTDVVIELVKTHKLYEIFHENSWTSSTAYDCRLAVANALSDTYLDAAKYNSSVSNVTILDWWTTFLRLLVDDSYEVRSIASDLIYELNKPLECCPLKMFFETFCTVYSEYPSSIFAACFVWSLSLSEDDSGINQSDVFNKCYNYEIYDPLLISLYCGLCVRKLLEGGWDPECIFETNLQQWLSNKLDMGIAYCSSPQMVINSYKQRLPKLQNNLNDLLDPTYNDKLLKVLALKEFYVIFNRHSI